MSVGGMEAPYSIASIPRPIDGVNGQVHAAPVYGVRESKKRKRHEVVVGVDGESVNIYNIQSQRVVTSYALPPQSYLCCPPSSVHTRAANNSPARRRTYCAVKDGPKEKRRKLVCFIDSSNRDDAQPVAPEKKELKLSDGEIASLDVVSMKEGRLAVIVTYASGATQATDGDLSKIIDLGHPTIETSEDYEVDCAGVVEIESVRKSLLKNREDAAMLLDQMQGAPTLQWRILRTATARLFELYGFKLSQLEGVQTGSRSLTTLISYELPSTAKNIAIRAVHELHAPSGTLYLLVGHKLSIYDLSGTTPKLVTRIGTKSDSVSSFTRLSTSSLLTCGRERITIYDTKFGSVQGSISLSKPSAESKSRKRKHDEMERPSGSLEMISSFAELGLAAGIYGHDLMLLSLPDSTGINKRSKGRGTRLVDIMGKGSRKDALRAEKRADNWEEWTEKIDELVSEDDIEGLEELVANEKNLGRQRKPHNLEDSDDESQDSSTYEEMWPLPETFDPAFLDKSKVLYILRNVFSPGHTQDSRLEIAIQSSKLIEWLALTGFLNVTSIRRPARPTDHEMLPGDIMAAVRKIDDDFQLTHDLLNLPIHWEVEEIVQALRQILQSFNTDPPAEPQLALPAPPQPNGDSKLANGDTADSELEVAENELDHAVSALTTGLEVRSDALRAIFARLHALHPSDVKATMRAMMSQEELFFLIHILRIELADGGWTSRYVDVGEGENGAVEGGMVDTLAGMEESGPSNEGIRVIGFLLNCAVDAIGVSGWLVGLGGNWNAKDLVESLRAEVSAGYEGCLEANTVQAFLAEIEKFERTMKKPIVQAENDMEMDAVLPMGGRASPPLVKNRNDKGGRKSLIAKAHEKSRRVGKYSFERIRI